MGAYNFATTLTRKLEIEMEVNLKAFIISAIPDIDLPDEAFNSEKETWLLIIWYDRVYVNGSDFWPKSQNLKENFLNK